MIGLGEDDNKVKTGRAAKRLSDPISTQVPSSYFLFPKSSSIQLVPLHFYLCNINLGFYGFFFFIKLISVHELFVLTYDFAMHLEVVW